MDCSFQYHSKPRNFFATKKEKKNKKTKKVSSIRGRAQYSGLLSAWVKDGTSASTIVVGDCHIGALMSIFKPETRVR